MIKFCFVIITVLAVIITVYDKYAAKKLPRNRIPENVLLLIGIFGGAFAEYITMKIIRHKTRHKKFMIGLPLISALHIIIMISVYLVKF